MRSLTLFTLAAALLIAYPALAGAAPGLVSVAAPDAAIKRGAIISEGQLTRVDVSAANARTALSLDDIVGREARRDLAPGQPIRAFDIKDPDLIKRGQAVTMVVRQGGLTIAAQGRALQDGALGQTIRVQNTASSHVVDGAITASGVVVVAMNSAPAIPDASLLGGR